MKIVDSLRQECMPEMVYVICKLAGSKEYNKEKIKELITLNCAEDSGFNKVYRFAIDCEFIKENPDRTVSISFDKNQLTSFKNFRYAVFMKVFKNNSTKFVLMAKWFLSQDQTIFKKTSAQELALALPVDFFGGVEADYVLGFRFWMVALGLGMFYRSPKGNALIFDTSKIILDWVTITKPFEKGDLVQAKDFFYKLKEDCPVFEDCINSNKIKLSLSMGLRVLHFNNVIEFKYTADSNDVWYLDKSISSPNTNYITEIIVR